MVMMVPRIYAIGIALLAVIGLFTNGRLFGLINVDIALDLLRVFLAAVLVYASMSSTESTTRRAILMMVGITYVAIGIIGLFSPTLLGLLPSGLTGFDIVLHLLSGAIAIIIAGYRQQPAVL